MKAPSFLVLLVLLLLSPPGSPLAGDASAVHPGAPWPFFAMTTATRDATHATADAQVRLVRELGYDGIGSVPPGELAGFAEACDRHSVRLWNTYFTVEIDGAPPLDPQLAAALSALKGREAVLWVGLTSRKHQPSSSLGDDEAVKVVTRLADLAESLGARVALYPHAGFWVERTDDALRVARAVNRPNLGVTFNLCHFLKVEDEGRLEEVIRSAKDRLFVVSLNGADTGRRGADWNVLIQTLDRGSFDNTRLQRALQANGYTGPIGFQGYGIGGDAEDNLKRTMSAWRRLNELRATPVPAANGSAMRFEPDGAGGFRFNTGVMRGSLHTGGKSLGLTGVSHLGTGARLDRGNGLLSHYRVFTKGVRYGAGAWDWPGEATLRDATTVEVNWPATPDRPFGLRAIYRLAKPSTIEVETIVEARKELAGFEVFLASYFDPAFTNAVVMAKTAGGAAENVEATVERGDWQMYPRDASAKELIDDGRWQLEPNPVAWKFPFEFAGPTAMAQRRADGPGVSAILAALDKDCFAIALPHQTEGHYSLYLSLFGRTIKEGESSSARAQLIVGKLPVR